MLVVLLVFPQKGKEVLVLKLPAYLLKKNGLKMLGLNIKDLTQAGFFKSELLRKLRKHFHGRWQKGFRKMRKMSFLFIRKEDEVYYTFIKFILYNYKHVYNLRTIIFHFLVGLIWKTIALSVLAYKLFALLEKKGQEKFLQNRIILKFWEENVAIKNHL